MGGLAHGLHTHTDVWMSNIYEEDRRGKRGACWWRWLPLCSWAPRPALLIISHPEAEAALSPWPAVYLFQTQDSNNLGKGQTSQGPRWQKSYINFRLLTLSPGQERLETDEGEAFQARDSAQPEASHGFNFCKSKPSVFLRSLSWRHVSQDAQGKTINKRYRIRDCMTSCYHLTPLQAGALLSSTSQAPPPSAVFTRSTEPWETLI